MPARTIEGPDWPGQHGTAEQCAAYVGIDKSLWMELHAADLIDPPGAQRSRETLVWHWYSAVVVSLSLVRLTGRLLEWKREQKKNPK